jgi:hypothetical protein
VGLYSPESEGAAVHQLVEPNGVKGKPPDERRFGSLVRVLSQRDGHTRAKKLCLKLFCITSGFFVPPAEKMSHTNYFCSIIGRA